MACFKRPLSFKITVPDLRPYFPASDKLAVNWNY